MERKRVNLEKHVFPELIASAFGTLSLECAGFLAGNHTRKNRDNLFVESVYNCQLVKHGPSELEFNDAELKRIRKILNVVGGFHSHIDSKYQKKGKITFNPGRVILSNVDLNYLKQKYPNGTEIIIALHRTKRQSLKKVEDLEIKGNISYAGRDYQLRLGAYYLDESHRKRRASLRVNRGDLREYL